MGAEVTNNKISTDTTIPTSETKDRKIKIHYSVCFSFFFLYCKNKSPVIPHKLKYKLYYVAYYYSHLYQHLAHTHSTVIKVGLM